MVDPRKQEVLLKYVAFAALGFASLMCLLVILNFLQLSRIDPVNTEVINALVERLNEDPSDAQLREQVRELDLLARKAYFTNRWQVRYGGYIILISTAIFLLIYQYLIAGKRTQVMADPDAPRDVLGINKSARLGISIVGGLLVITALVLSFTMQKKMYPSEAMANGEAVSVSRVQPAREEGPANEEGGFSPQAGSVESGRSQEEVVEETESLDATVPVDDGVERDEVEAPENVEKQEAQEITPFPTVAELKRNAPTFRGHNGNGKIFQANVPSKWNGLTGENILWKVPVPLAAYNSPIVWEDRIFLTGANAQSREVYCFSKQDGQLLWTTKVTGIPGSPAVAPKTTEDTGLGAPTMTTDGRRVYAIFGTGDLLALDMDGKIVWAKNLGVPQNHYGHSSSLIMHQEKLIVQYDQKSNGRIMAFEASTGNPLWSTPRSEKVSWASPILVYHDNKSQIIVVADPTVAAYDPWTGKQLWSLHCISGEVGPSACYDKGIVYAVNDYANIAAIDLNNTSETLWESWELLSDIPSPVASNGLLLVPASYGALACYDGLKGEILWEHELNENVFSSPILVGDMVYLMDTKGVMHIFRLSREGYKAVADNPLGEEAVCTPAFADGRIYIRTNKYLYCIGK